MSDAKEQEIFKVENDAGRFPAQMLLIPNLFEFSFSDYETLMKTAFSCNAELVSSLQKAIDHIADSELDADLKDQVTNLIEDELEVVAYSQSARCAVISM